MRHAPRGFVPMPIKMATLRRAATWARGPWIPGMFGGDLRPSPRYRSPSFAARPRSAAPFTRDALRSGEPRMAFLAAGGARHPRVLDALT